MVAKASKYFQNNVEILGGEVTIHTIPASNGVWQMRMWIEAEQRRFMRSLRTKNLDEAKVKAKKIYAEVMSDTAKGKKLFGEKFGEVGEQWLIYQKQRSEAGYITKGRVSTLTTQVRKHIVPFVQDTFGINAKIGSLEYSSFFDYGLYRRKHTASVTDVTIRNEQTTIGSLIRWAFRNGYVAFEKCDFEEIKISEPPRRDTFTDQEYQQLYVHMRDWVKAEPQSLTKSNMMPLKRKQFMRDAVLISANSAMRVGELRQLKWSMVKSVFHSGSRYYAEIHLPKEITKNRKDRRFVTAGGEFFRRIKTYSNFTEPNDFVICNNDDGQQISKSEFYRVWRDLIETSQVEIGDRHITFYSLRHFAISGHLLAGRSVFDVANFAGTSVHHIQTHYAHVDMTKQLAEAKKRYRMNKAGQVERFELN